VSNVGAAASAATADNRILHWPWLRSPAPEDEKNKPVVENGPRLREVSGASARA